MNQIERIAKMEEYLDASAQAVRELSEALDRYEAVQGQLKKLGDYYASPRWLKDFEDDEAGKLPPELKRGVLSEDAVFDLLADNRELTLRMLGHITRVLKNADY